jgi:hypothetical protein
MFRYDLWWLSNQAAPKNSHTYGIQVLSTWGRCVATGSGRPLRSSRPTEPN